MIFNLKKNNLYNIFKNNNNWNYKIRNLQKKMEKEKKNENENEKKRKFIIPNGAIKERLDKFLSNQEKTLSRSTIQKLIRTGNVFINGKPILKTNHKIKEKDEIEIYNFLNKNIENEIEIKPEKDIFFPIIYEDDSIIGFFLLIYLK